PVRAAAPLPRRQARAPAPGAAKPSTSPSSTPRPIRPAPAPARKPSLLHGPRIAPLVARFLVIPAESRGPRCRLAFLDPRPHALAHDHVAARWAQAFAGATVVARTSSW